VRSDPRGERSWIAAETLTDVVVDRTCEAAGHGNLDALARSWVLSRAMRTTARTPMRRARIRRDAILGGDADAHAQLKKASDGFEHGFLYFERVRAHAEPAASTPHRARSGARSSARRGSTRRM
jgi:hypothetical protein